MVVNMLVSALSGSSVVCLTCQKKVVFIIIAIIILIVNHIVSVIITINLRKDCIFGMMMITIEAEVWFSLCVEPYPM